MLEEREEGDLKVGEVSGGKRGIVKEENDRLRISEREETRVGESRRREKNYEE